MKILRETTLFRRLGTSTAPQIETALEEVR